jgi:hypothetical protein
VLVLFCIVDVAKTPAAERIKQFLYCRFEEYPLGKGVVTCWLWSCQSKMDILMFAHDLSLGRERGDDCFLYL